MSTKRNLSFHELFEMGAFTIPPSNQQTRSGRISKRPKHFHEENFTKGSGCCPLPDTDPTDMRFDGTKP